MQENTLARRYAAALVSLAGEQGVLNEVGEELASFAGVVAATPTLRSLLESPASDPRHQSLAMENYLAQAAPSILTGNFLRLLAQKRRMSLIAAIHAAYQRELDQRAGRLTAQVRAAMALGDTLQGQLQQKLSQVTGKNVSLELEVDPALLGGLVVQIGSTMMDYSVRSRLNRLKSYMKG